MQAGGDQMNQKSKYLFLSLAGITLTACGAPSFMMKVLQEAPLVCKNVIGELGVTENLSMRWDWATSSSPSYNEVMSTPMVADLDGDGAGEIIFNSFSTDDITIYRFGRPGILRVISGATAKEIASTTMISTPGSVRPYGISNIAIYDLDMAKDSNGKLNPEILVYAERSVAADTTTGIHSGMPGLAVYQLIKGSDGKFQLSLKSFKDMTQAAGLITGAFTQPFQNTPIAAHRIFHDQRIYIEAAQNLWQFNPDNLTLAETSYVSSVIGVMDLNSGPGFEGMEILQVSNSAGTTPDASVKVLSADRSPEKSKFYSLEKHNTKGTISSFTGVAFGNFSTPASTDVLLKKESNLYVDSTGAPRFGPLGIILMKGATGAVRTEWVQSLEDFNGCKDRISRIRGYERAISNASIAGPVNVGDINGDKINDLTFAGACKIYALKGVDDPVTGFRFELLWSKESFDVSSASTGSSIFDFNGDGRVEVLYNDEESLRIYSGETGDVIAVLPNNTGTRIEYPVVVSLRKNEPASIIIPANRYQSKIQGPNPNSENLPYEKDVTGIRIIQAPEWMPSRTIWNQYLYTITNVEDDLSVPFGQKDFGTKSGMTRSNVQARLFQKACYRDESQRKDPIIIISK